MNRKVLAIEKIQECIESKKVIWTEHCLKRMNQRNILISEVKEAIRNGKIIEQYELDYPYPSCLIIGKNKGSKTLHTVVGVGKNIIYIITSYYPDRNQWENNIKRRKHNELF